MPVIYVHITSTIVVVSRIVIIDPQATNPSYLTVSIPYIDIANLAYTTVVIVIYAHIFHLNNRAVIVVLYIGVVIVARVKGNAGIAYIYLCAGTDTIVDVKIEFTVGIHRKRNAVLFKNEGFPVVGIVSCCDVLSNFCLNIGDAQQEYNGIIK